MTKSKLLLIVFASSLFFGIGALLLAQFFLPFHFDQIFTQPAGWLINIGLGAILGVVTGYAAWWVVTRSFMTPVRSFFQDIFQGLNLDLKDIIFISLCAGIGEELLFRGVIQYWLGVFWTAVLFVALHGYLNPANWRLSVFGLFMVVAVALFGFSTQNIGLLSAIVAHTAVDIILLLKLTQSTNLPVNTAGE